uniref:Protein arginine N-methyltransferase domain-containing protein n=1 Tax=Cacopsylla melanoneura TaxID=428564 RepID=A0A8D9EDN8_9HEMI
MLNDTNRNEKFKSAIVEAIRDGYTTVLDIGTGTGLLSLYAAEHGAEFIFACDYSNTMIQIASQVIQRNQMEDRIKLIPKLSNDINIPDDIPHKVHLVVTETLDAGGIGEHILQTVKHALENLVFPCQPQGIGKDLDQCQDQNLDMDEEPCQTKTKSDFSERKWNQSSVSQSMNEPKQNNITETKTDPMQTSNERHNPSQPTKTSMSSQPLTNESKPSQLKPGGLIIPSRLRIFAQVIECEYLRTKYKFRMNIEHNTHCRQSSNQNSGQKTQNRAEESTVENPDVCNETGRNKISREDASGDIPMEFTSRCQIELQNPNSSETNTCPEYWKRNRSDTNCKRCKENRNRGISPNSCCYNSGKQRTSSEPNRGKLDTVPTDRDNCSKPPETISIQCNQTQEDSKKKNQASQTPVINCTIGSMPRNTRGSIPGKVGLVLNAKKQHYDSEHLAHIPHKVLSHPVQVLSVDLNSLQDVNRVLDGVQQRFTLNHVANGQADAIVSWFELDLYRNNRISSCIENNTHWDQAVFPVIQDIVFHTPCSLNDEQTMVEYSNSHINVDNELVCNEYESKDNIHGEFVEYIPNADEYDNDKQFNDLDTENNSKFPKTNDPKTDKLNPKNDSTKRDSKETEFNTQHPTKKTKVKLTMTCKDGLINLELDSSEATLDTHKPNEITTDTNTNLRDIKISANTLETNSCESLNFNLNNKNSVSNIAQIKHKAPHKSLLELNVPSDVIQCCRLMEHHVDSIVANITERMSSVRNVLDLTKFPLLGIECLKTFPSCKLFYLLDDATDSILTSQLTSLHIDPVRYYCLTKSDLKSDLGSHVKFDVVLVDILDTRGDFVGLQYLSSVMSCLSATCLLLPERVNIYCQLIDCSWLNTQGHMLAEDDKFGIAPFINQYQVSQHPDLDISSLSHTPLSTSCLLSSLPLTDLFSPSTTNSLLSPSSSGCVNGLSYWMRLELSPGVEVTRTRGVFHVNPGVRCTEDVPLCVQMRYEPGYISLSLVQSTET